MDNMKAQNALTTFSPAKAFDFTCITRNIFIYAITIILSIVFLFPFFWTLMSSLKSPRELMAWPPTMLPRTLIWRNYRLVFEYNPYARWIYNTLIITSLSTFGVTISSMIAAYSFSRLRFPGRSFLFAICLSTMILPAQVTIVPRFILFRHIGWINTYYPLIIPSFGGTAFSIFLLRQFIMGLPYELDEAAFIDGASRLTILMRILVPLCKPALATVIIFALMGNWNAFLDPFIFLSSPEKYPLGVGLRYLVGVADGGEPTEHILMAGTVMMVVPIIIVFFLAQDYFMQGIATTGLKG